MRRLLGWASIFSCVLIVLTVVMWSRSRERADWVRVAGRHHAAVMTTSRDHVGAAFVADPTGWFVRQGPPVRYQSFVPRDLSRSFPSSFFGFAYHEDHGVHLVLAPMWAVMMMAVVPPMLWLQQKRRRHA
jgi:hypothetical protein